MGWTRKDLLAMRDLDASEILLLVDTAASLQEIATREIKKVPALRGKTVVNLFYEASTRTRTSFEIAGKWLSADVVNFSASGSSTSKGESFIDTAKNIEAMSPNVVVVRHSKAGSKHDGCNVANGAGNGCGSRQGQVAGTVALSLPPKGRDSSRSTARAPWGSGEERTEHFSGGLQRAGQLGGTGTGE